MTAERSFLDRFGNRLKMVDFRSVLEEVVGSVPGSLAGMIIGRDGIPIEKYQSDRFNLDADMVCAEFAGIMAEVQKVISILHLEDLKDVRKIMSRLEEPYNPPAVPQFPWSVPEPQPDNRCRLPPRRFRPGQRLVSVQTF